MNKIVEQRLKDMESKVDIKFTDKTDYVKVVRCKDCIHSDDYECTCPLGELVNNPEFFCADGERKELK